MSASESPIVLDGRWELTSDILGTGAFGKVYLGVDLEIKQNVAIKYFSSKYTSTNNAKGAQKEVNFLRFITYFRVPGVVQLLAGPIEAAAGWYAVYNLVVGRELADYLEAVKMVPMTFAQQQRVSGGLYSMMLELAQTVEKLSDLCIVHQDLKPQNIMKLKNDYRVTVVDFGLSCVRRDCDVQLPNTRRRFALPDVLPRCSDYHAGTPGYRPPEYTIPNLQYSERRIDVYALGRVLYDMGTGRPYPDVERERWTNFTAEDVEGEVSRHSTGISELDQLIVEMMHPLAHKRPTLLQVVQRMRSIELNGRVLAITITAAMREQAPSPPEVSEAKTSKPHRAWVSGSQDTPSAQPVTHGPDLREADDLFGNADGPPSRPQSASDATVYLPDTDEDVDT
jgi:serine/threonine-protein kinase